MFIRTKIAACMHAACKTIMLGWLSVMTVWLPVKMCSSDPKFTDLVKDIPSILIICIQLIKSIISIGYVFKGNSVPYLFAYEFTVTLVVSRPDDAFIDLTSNSSKWMRSLLFCWIFYRAGTKFVSAGDFRLNGSNQYEPQYSTNRLYLNSLKNKSKYFNSVASSIQEKKIFKTV